MIAVAGDGNVSGACIGGRLLTAAPLGVAHARESGPYARIPGSLKIRRILVRGALSPEGLDMGEKIDDTLDAYATLLPTVAADLRRQVKAWVDAHPILAKSSIELGGKLHSAAEKDRRRAVRAHLLATQALGLLQPGQSIDTLRADLLKLNLATLKDRLVSDISPYVMDLRDSDKMVFGWSFRTPGTASLRDRCGYARRTIGGVLKSAYNDVSSSVKSRKATPAYASYFGPFHAERAKQAMDCIGSMLVRSQTESVWFYYRGQSLTPHAVYSDWPYLAGELNGLCAEDHHGASIKPEQRKLGLRPHRNALQDDEGLHVKIGKGAEGKSHEELLHILIHELSHFIAGTRDVKAPGIVLGALTGRDLTLNQSLAAMDSFITKDLAGQLSLISRNEFYERSGKDKKLPPTHVRTGKPALGRRAVVDAYGAEVCRALAENYPDKAVWNADSVAYYCMQFAV